MMPKELAEKITNILDQKGAMDITVLSVEHLTSITDYFVIATGRNSIAVRSLAEDVEEKMMAFGEEARRREGMNESRWVVLDYASVIVHIFHPEERAYYNIERLWVDGDNQVHFERVAE